MWKKNRVTIVAVTVIGVLSLVPVFFLFREGFFLSDDGEWMVIRFSAFYQTLREGQLPPRFFTRLNHGFGYPIGVFLYPAFMYLAVPFKLIGLSFQESIKAVIIASFFFSGIGSFLWLRQRFSTVAAAIGALVYVYFPYHIFDLYVRGSIGELVAFAVLPFLLYFIGRKNSIISSFLYGLLILSHNTFAFLVTPFLLVYTYFRGARELFLIYPLGLLLSAFFWLPSLMELPLTKFAQTSISRWQEYFLTAKTMGLVGGISLVGILGVVKSLTVKKDRETQFFAVVFLLSLFFAIPLSSFFWDMELLPKLVQFPWRFLILTLIAASYLIAFWLHTLIRLKLIIASILVSVIILLSALPYVQEYRSVIRDDGYYATNEDTTTTHDEYMPLWVKDIPDTRPESPVFLTDGQGDLSDIHRNASGVQFILRAEEPVTTVINTIDYPGWTVTVNGQKSVYKRTADGLLSLSLSPGEHQVTTRFIEPPFRLFADLLSLSTAIVILLFLIPPIRERVLRKVSWYNKTIWKKM